MARHLLLKPVMRVEMRARLPTPPGVWPLVWAVQAKRWPEGLEAVLLTSTTDPVRLRTSTRLGTFFQPAFGPPVTAGFAIYAMTWSSTGIHLDRDGVQALSSAVPPDPSCAHGEAQAILYEGVQGFIQKPFKKNDLLTEIATVVKKDR